MTPKIYDAKNVTLMIGGLLIDSGYADGEFIRIEAEQDAFAAVQGTDGEVTRSKTNNTLFTATLTLMQTSSGNSKLTALHTLDLLADNGAGVGPFLVKDRSGTALAAGVCWIARPPDPTYDKTATSREWKIQVVIPPGGKIDGGS
jgi:hypothetical protein